MIEAETRWKKRDKWREYERHGCNYNAIPHMIWVVARHVRYFFDPPYA